MCSYFEVTFQRFLLIIKTVIPVIYVSDIYINITIWYDSKAFNALMFTCKNIYLGIKRILNSNVSLSVVLSAFK